MAKIGFGMNLSLDGYVDHDAFGPDAVLFRHFIDQVRGAAASIYGRRLYEVMRYGMTSIRNGAKTSVNSGTPGAASTSGSCHAL
jgi:hypothetical protein